MALSSQPWGMPKLLKLRKPAWQRAKYRQRGYWLRASHRRRSSRWPALARTLETQIFSLILRTDVCLGNRDLTIKVANSCPGLDGIAGESPQLSFEERGNSK